MNISKENPGLLLLDNHQSHISLEVINIAEKNGLNILNFSPTAATDYNLWTFACLVHSKHFIIAFLILG